MAGSTTIRELLVKLGIDAEKGEAGLKSFDEGLDKVKEGMTNLVGYAVKASAAIAALGAASIFTAVRTGEHAEQIREQAAALGVTTDAYQELSFIASKYGIDSEKITVILSKLAVDQKAIAEGNKDTTATYAQLGLSVDEVRKAKPAELFAMMADGFGTVTDASTRLAIGSELFGDRIASKLLPLLATGSAGLEAMAQQAHRLGVVMSEESILAADEFNDQVENLGLVLTGVRNEIGLALIPALTRLSRRFLAWYEANQELIAQKLDEYAGKIGDAFTALGDAVAWADGAVGGVEGWKRLATLLAALVGATGLTLVAFQIGVVVSGLYTMVAAAIALDIAFLPLLIIYAVLILVSAALATFTVNLAGTALALEDLATYLRGGESGFGRLIERMKEAGGATAALAGLIEALLNHFVAFFDFVGAGWDGLAAGISGAVDQMLAFLKPWIGEINVVGASLQWLADIIDEVTAGVDFLTRALGGETGAQSKGTGIGAATASAARPGARNQLNQSSAAFAPAAIAGRGGAAAGAGRSVSVGGDTITISGVGITAEQVEAIIAHRGAEKSRMTRDAMAGAEL